MFFLRYSYKNLFHYIKELEYHSCRTTLIHNLHQNHKSNRCHSLYSQ
nr:MAG TPA: hypothetical protein [Caudoviricetes sp.]